MTTPTISFLDTNGIVLITGVPYTFGNWVPDVDEVCDRQTPQGTGLEEFWSYRTDHVASFELSNIPAADVAKLVRLKRHLLTGGFVTVSTNDAASRVYTVSVKPGETPSWTLSDRVNVEHTLSLAVRNVAPFPMLAVYTGVGGTTTNEITNGGGETGTAGSQATGWTKSNGNALVPATDEAVIGSRSLKIVNAATADSHNSQSSISVTAGERWLLSGWVKSSSLTAGGAAGASIDVKSSDAEWTVVKQRGDSRDDTKTTTGHPADGKAHGWKYVYILLDVTTSGSATVELVLATTGSGTAWFDGVRFEPVPIV